MRKFIIVTSVFCVYLLFRGICFSQVEEEKKERLPQMQMLRKKPANYNLTSQAALFSGYDNNVKLSPQRKGSGFQESLYSLNFNKLLSSNLSFSLDYDLDYLNYNDANSFTNLLNHFRAGLYKRLSKSFAVGTGYDFSDFYFPDDSQGDFMFHKGFIYLRNYILSNTFQQLGVEYGYKRHSSRKALGDTASELQDKRLIDNRRSIEYSIVSNSLPRFSLQFSSKFSVNDSNAKYIDFFDYRSWEFSPGIIYKLSEKINLVSYFTYLRKNYTSRTISTGTQKEHDNTYYANLGAKCKVDKNNIASLFYTYRDNSTNEPLEKYTESVFTLGWQHNF